MSSGGPPPPMPPGVKLPPRPPGMRPLPPMPPGFKAPGAAGAAPPLPPGRYPQPVPGQRAPAPAPGPGPGPGAGGHHPVGAYGGPAAAASAPGAYLRPPAGPASADAYGSGYPRYPVPQTSPPPGAAPAHGHPPTGHQDGGHYPRYLAPPQQHQHQQGGAPRAEVPYITTTSRAPEAPTPYPLQGPYQPRDNYYGSHGGGGRYESERYGGRGRRGNRGPRGGGRGGGSRNFEESTLPMRDPTNTVWVGSVDPAIHTEASLRSAFWPFGRVMEVSIHADKSYAFVHMRSVEEAHRAVEALTQSRLLGPALFNYSKMFEYTPEQMSLPHDPNHVEEPAASPVPQPSVHTRRREEADDIGSRPPARRARPDREGMEPSNVLWVGNLVPYITDERLREIFEVFGNIELISRMERGNMAFIHFDTEDHCTMALQTMRGRPIEGVMLAINYGHPQRNTEAVGGAEGGSSGPALTADGIPVNEVPSNVIYLGQLPADTDEKDVEDLFAPFEGFIHSKYVVSNSIGFGHFDSLASARVARAALQSALIKGTPIRVSFGKQNHSFTMADRRRIGDPDPAQVSLPDGEFNLDAMMRGEQDGGSGALMVGSYGGGAGSLTLPAMGGGVDAANGTAAGNVYDRPRVAPEMTLDNRLQSLLGSTYNNCGAKGLELSPSQIQAICHMVDECVNDESYRHLDQTILLYCPLKTVHVFNIVAKRMREYYVDDPHKRLLVLYAATHALLSAETEYVPYTAAALNAYLMVLMVASEGQTSSGVDRLFSIIESLQSHTFIEKKSNAGADYIVEFKSQLEDIQNRAKAEQDCRTLLTRRRRR